MKFLVWEEDGETREDASTYEATDAQDAAIAWASDYDVDDYELLQGGSVVCLVAPVDGSRLPMRFWATGEAEPTYWAEEL